MIIQESITDEVRHHHACSIGAIAVPAFNAHEYLTKIKLGALLALLEDHLVVSESDWHLAGIMWAIACKVRDHCLALADVAEAFERRARNLSYADREEMAEVRRQRVRDASAKVIRIARLIAKHVHVGTPSEGPARTASEVSRRSKSTDRASCDEALSYAVSGRDGSKRMETKSLPGHHNRREGGAEMRTKCGYVNAWTLPHTHRSLPS